MNSTKVKGTQPKNIKKEMPVVHIEGDAVNQFIATDEAFKRAKDENDAAKDYLRRIADKEYYGYICGEKTTVPSISVVDSTGATATYTSQNKYSPIDVDTANSAFGALKKKADDYCAEVVVASFDSKLLMDKTGKLNVSLFEAYYDAINAVAKKFGVANPLKAVTAVVVKPDFHSRRSSDFTPKQNLVLSESVKNTVTITAVCQGNTEDAGNIEDLFDGEEK